MASGKVRAEASGRAPGLDVRSASAAKGLDAGASWGATAGGRALKDDEFHDWEFL